MIVVKNINNNVSLCLDSKNNEVIVFGKGVGFIKPPYEIPLEKIEKTFYNVKEEQISLINLVPVEILEVSFNIVDYANQKLGNQFESNVVFTLADHISFAIKRHEQNIKIKMPLLQEIEQTYEEECYVGKKALKMIENKLAVKLPKSEAASIAMHLVNYEALQKNTEDTDYGNIVNNCISSLEKILNITVNKDSFSYYRFVTHLYYLIKRIRNNQMIESQNAQLFHALKEEFPEVLKSALDIKKIIKEQLGRELSDEELIYLMLHINRLCSREDYD
ncbi:PRD domain-containing protein [Anaerocolumna sp. AGMB13025]|uniref:PRD domain-containing protein n=1 Tax=Anaerocolumna sp. AGMB13025 TaxID=3039116 RepID=UPI00241C09F7|nr:PRD domain-containing protein [Anaerocolumna sp. AGMB13025]WFR55770.1 PRD domain-containing protein [Anaerocolumna sp. AGMB13025]